MKGILEGKEKNFERFKNEKEEIIFNFKKEIVIYKDEIEFLKEIKIKYEYLEEKLKKINNEENNKSLNLKISQSERKIMELQEENKKLKKYDIDKVKILEKAENLSKEVYKLKNENITMNREIEKYVNKLSTGNTDKNQIDNNISEHGKILEMKVKLEVLNEENNEILKEKKELEEIVEKLNDDLNQANKKLEKLKKKEEKYEKLKIENNDNFMNMSQLKEDNLKQKDQINNLKIQEKKITQDFENKFSVFHKFCIF